jgi:hypothetical protein
MESGGKKRWVLITLLLSLAAGPLACVVMTMWYGQGDFWTDYAVTIALGFLFVWVCYLAILFSVVGLWNEEDVFGIRAEGRPSPLKWSFLQVLACAAIAFMAWDCVSHIPLRPLRPVYLVETVLLYPLGYNLVSVLWLTACVATLLRRRWTAHFMLITCLWMLTLKLSALPSLFSWSDAVFQFGKMRVALGLWWPWLAKIALLTVLAVGWALIAKADSPHPPGRFSSIARHIVYKGRYLSVAVLLMLAAFFVQWLHADIVCSDLGFIRTSLLITGALLAMSVQVLSYNAMLVPAAVALPVILLAFEYFGEDAQHPFTRHWTDPVLAWSPLFLLSLIAAFGKYRSMRLRVVVLIVPVIFAFLAYIVPFQKRCWVSPEYSKPFPEYLEPPAGAELGSFHHPLRYKYDPPRFIGITYDVNESYPSSNTLEFLGAAFADAGFLRLEYDLDAPRGRSGHWMIWAQGSTPPPASLPEDVAASWNAYWMREADTMVLDVRLFCYGQGTNVTVTASHPVGWSRRAIELRHRIQYYREIHNKTDIME